MNRTKTLLIVAVSLLVALLLPLACDDSAAPKPGVCDREKRAVWSAVGHQDPVPDSLMKIEEWNLANSDRGLDGETYYFMEFRSQPGVCHVLRA